MGYGEDKGVRREEGVIIMTCSALQLREGGKKEREGEKKNKVKRNKGRKCRREKKEENRRSWESARCC